jgi:hypothetical protein
MHSGGSIEEYCSRLEKESDELREADYILKKTMVFLGADSR